MNSNEAFNSYIESAKLYKSKGHYIKAAKECDSALRIFPNNIAAMALSCQIEFLKPDVFFSPSIAETYLNESCTVLHNDRNFPNILKSRDKDSRELIVSLNNILDEFLIVYGVSIYNLSSTTFKNNLLLNNYTLTSREEFGLSQFQSFLHIDNVYPERVNRLYTLKEMACFKEASLIAKSYWFIENIAEKRSTTTYNILNAFACAENNYY